MAITNLLNLLIPLVVWGAIIIFAVQAVSKLFKYHETEISLLKQILDEKQKENSDK